MHLIYFVYLTWRCKKICFVRRLLSPRSDQATMTSHRAWSAQNGYVLQKMVGPCFGDITEFHKMQKSPCFAAKLDRVRRIPRLLHSNEK